MLWICFFLTLAALTGNGPVNAVEKESSLVKTGFLLLAPDRGFLGNQDIQDVFAEFKSSYPAALAFTGREFSGTGGDYSGYLTQAVEELKRGGASDIVVIPLFLTVADPLLKKSITRLAPPAATGSTGIPSGNPVRWASPLAQSYLTAQILLDRAVALGQDPAQERLVIVGLGAVDEDSEQAIRSDLERMSRYVAHYRPFREIQIGIYYDRSAEAGLRERKNQAVDDLVIKTAARKGKTLLIPFFIGTKHDSHMSMTHGLKMKFAEFDVTYDAQEILPHPNVLLWLKKTANHYLDSTPEETGIVIMPHGANQPYNDAVEQVIAPLKSRYKIEMAYGMADAETLRRAVVRLETQGVRHIVFVRLYALSNQMKGLSDYILGLSDIAPDEDHATHNNRSHGASVAFSPPPPQVRSQAVFSTFGGYEEAPSLAGILDERIMQISKDPATETVILVAHGSADDTDNERWLAVMNGHIERLRKKPEYQRFRAIQAITIREDWPDKREEALARLRKMIQQGNQNGGKIMLISNRLHGGGPYRELLKGETFVMNDKGFAPHPALTRWLEQGIENAVREMNIQARAMRAALQ